MITDEKELATLRDAVEILHRHFGGLTWNIEVGPVSTYDPSDFKPFRPVAVNGQLVNIKIEPLGPPVTSAAK